MVSEATQATWPRFAAVGAVNYYYGAIDAAKTRGTQFFPKSRAITAKLALLSLVMTRAALRPKPLVQQLSGA